MLAPMPPRRRTRPAFDPAPHHLHVIGFERLLVQTLSRFEDAVLKREKALTDLGLHVNVQDAPLWTWSLLPNCSSCLFQELTVGVAATALAIIGVVLISVIVNLSRTSLFVTSAS